MLLSPEAAVHSTATEPGHDHGRAPVPSIEIDSLRLLQGQRELRIRHGNECYRLRHTRNDKLILTK
ncbi:MULTISPECIES: hemin uptake protein HemP [unclassified Luteimonas]